MNQFNQPSPPPAGQPSPPPPAYWPTLPPINIGPATLKALPRRATKTLMEIADEQSRRLALAQAYEEKVKRELPIIQWTEATPEFPTPHWTAIQSFSITHYLKDLTWNHHSETGDWTTTDDDNVVPLKRYVREQDIPILNAHLDERDRRYAVSFAHFNPDLRPWRVEPTNFDSSNPPAIEPSIPLAYDDERSPAYEYQTVIMPEILKRNLLLTDQMGLGKTIQAIQAINTLARQHPNPDEFNCLIVVPNTMFQKWISEIQKWMDPNIAFPYIWPWSQLPKHMFAKDTDPNSKTFNKFITSKPILNVEWDLVIVDEAHYAKNTDSIRSKAFRALKVKPGTGRRLCLTGTPILGKPSEIWPIADWVEPGVLGTFNQFERKYMLTTLARYGYRQVYKTKANMERITDLQIKLRRTIMVGREKEKVLPQLPAKQRSIVEIDYGKQVQKIEDEIASLYDSMKAKVKDKEIWANIFKLRHQAALLKVPKTCELIEEIWMEANGDTVIQEQVRPIVIFGFHTDVIMQLVKFCQEKITDPSRVEMLTGKQSPHERSVIIDRFQAGEYDILVVNLVVGGLGITLTRADLAIFAELDWSPTNLIQAEDRLHRIGQESKVNIYYTVSQMSIDGRFAKILGRKQAIIDAFTKHPEMP